MSDQQIATQSQTRQRTARYEHDDQSSEVEKNSPEERSGDACPTSTCDGQLIEDGSTKETYCNNCGLVVADDTIDHSAEWRAFDHSEKVNRKRVGQPRTPKMHDKGMSTTIGNIGYDSNGNLISGERRQQLSRIKTWHKRTVASGGKTRGLKKGLIEIKRMTSALGISGAVTETASVILREASDEDLLMGRSVEGVATASMYAAARLEEVTHSFGEVATVSRVAEKRIRRSYMHLTRNIEILVPPTPPEEYVDRFAGKLDVSTSVALTAERMLKEYQESGICKGVAPTSLAASALYASSLIHSEELTQAHVANNIDVSQPTVRKFYSELMEVSGEVDLSTLDGGATGNSADEIREHIETSESRTHKPKSAV